MRKLKYRLIFIRKENQLKYVYAIRVLHKINKFFSFNGKKYHIPIQNPVYLNKKNQFVYFIDVDSGSQYTFDESKVFLNPEQLGIALETRIVRDVAMGVSRTNQKMDWYSFFMGLFLGSLIVGVLVYLFMQNKIDTLMGLIEETQNPIYPF